MNQDTLAKEKLDAGYDFVSELNKVLPVSIAFWLKREDESDWYLYVASEKASDATIRQAYEQVLKVAHELGNPLLDPFEIKLLPASDPLALAAVDLRQRSSAALGAIFRNRQLGTVTIAGAYLYPALIAVT